MKPLSNDSSSEDGNCGRNLKSLLGGSKGGLQGRNKLSLKVPL